MCMLGMCILDILGATEEIYIVESEIPIGEGK